MILDSRFPFGQRLSLVQQADRQPKRAFVLGVYSSAVHARWVNTEGQTIVRALAVASEPYIFWRGDGADEIIKRIVIPPLAGKLLPADELENGPTGRALDEFILGPLGLTRENTWLCDLVPHSCVNTLQREAIINHYEPLRENFALTEASIPDIPKEMTDAARTSAILDELKESQAELVVLLGDEPVRWFLNRFDSRYRCLGDFGRNDRSYGRMHRIRLADRPHWVLPLVHPRQAARLGHTSPEWNKLHQSWVDK